MRQQLHSSGGSSLKLLGLVSAFSVVAVLAACAEAPVDDDPAGGTTSNVNKVEPEGESQKLPPPSNPPAEKKEEKDAGTTSSSSGGSSSGSTSSSGGSSSGSTSSSGGSSSGSTSSSGGSSSGGSAATCDPNDPLNLILALDELNKTSPRTCGLMGGSCASGECCFDIYGVCIDSP
jgi:hypothetical protein